MIAACGYRTADYDQRAHTHKTQTIDFRSLTHPLTEEFGDRIRCLRELALGAALVWPFWLLYLARRNAPTGHVTLIIHQTPRDGGAR